VGPNDGVARMDDARDDDGAPPIVDIPLLAYSDDCFNDAFLPP
jgi:hypothetical protein